MFELARQSRASESSFLIVLSTAEVSQRRAHAALSAEELADTSVGAFDLSSMFGALSFAQAILELKDQCQVIAAASKDNATTSFQWRSDNISVAEVTREERVSQWLQDVSSETQE